MVYNLRYYASARPDWQSKQRHYVLNLSVRSFVHLTKLVNTIFWKRIEVTSTPIGTSGICATWAHKTIKFMVRS